MPKKLNFLGGQQNYDADNGQYLPDLTNSKGEPIKGFKNFRKGDEDNDESFDTTNKKRMGKESDALRNQIEKNTDYKEVRQKSKDGFNDEETETKLHKYNVQNDTLIEIGKADNEVEKAKEIIQKAKETMQSDEYKELKQRIDNGDADPQDYEKYWTPIYQKQIAETVIENLNENDVDDLPNNDSKELKNKQFEIISKHNPMKDDYHVGIRSTDDIKTFAEVIDDDESFVYGDFSREDAKAALEKGKVKVYSSKPIEQGGFVSTSRNMAQDYAGGGQVYEKEVDLDSVAWINGDEGQFADTKQTSEESSFEEINKKRMGKSKKPNIDTSTPKGRYQYNKQLATNTEPGKIVKYHPLLKKPGEDFYFSEETERAKMLNNGIAMGTKKHSSWERYTKDAGGKYRPSNYYVLIDIETGLTCGRVENYEDGLEKTNDKEWLDRVNNARNTFKTKHPNHFEE